MILKKHDVILFHKDALNQKECRNFIRNSNSLKICASIGKDPPENWNAYIELPTSLKEINSVIENVVAKYRFNKNSSIKIKNYLLNKNEKKIVKK